MILGAATAPAGGAPLGQVIGATAAGLLLTAALYTLGRLHRSGRTRVLDVAATPFARLLRVPRWAALPAAVATGSVLIAGFGFYWDVAEHIDHGRDPGPFGTAAHYPILLGLFGIFTAGWLAVVMARDDEAARTGMRLMRGWTAPTSGVAMALCGAFALLGFPSDDLWHEVFGQDVTLWGPTHLILLTGGQLTIVCILGLLLEGRVAARRAGRRGLPGRGRLAVAVSGAGGVLAGLTVYQAEFGFGVPQYRLLFQPVLLAFSGALALVMARRVAGRGGALGAVAFYLVVSGAMALFVGPVLGRSIPHFPTYLAAAVSVEAAAFATRGRPRAFVPLAGLLVGVVGTLGEWGWTHVWMPIAWPSGFVPEAMALGVAAALCGAAVGGFVGRSLRPGKEHPTRPWVPAAAGMVGLAVIFAALVPTSVPAGSSATVTLDRAGNATVIFRPASVTEGADFVQELAWQGGTRSVHAPMRRGAPGVYRTRKPLPTSGDWKALIRLQNGPTLADVPVYLPADPAIPAAAIPASPHFTRLLISDSMLMQRERKRDVPGWLWGVAIAGVMFTVAILLTILGWSLNRVARRAATPDDRRSDVSSQPARRPRALARRPQRAARVPEDPARDPRPAS